jgi:hypothetical protein
MVAIYGSKRPRCTDINPTPPDIVFRWRLIVMIAAPRPRRSSRRDAPHLARVVLPPPWAGSTSTGWSISSERPSLALLPGCPPLPPMPPQPIVDPPATSSPKKHFTDIIGPIPRNGTIFEEYSISKKAYRMGLAGDLGDGSMHILFF